MSDKDYILEVKNLNYEKKFNNLNMKITNHSYIAISGVNASGKTLLIKLMSNLLTSKKNIKYKGKYLEDINKNILFREIAVLFFEDELNFNYNTVEEELFAILENIDMMQKEKISEYKKIIKLLKIQEILNINPNELSHFNKIKLLLATVLISRPQVILIDNLGFNLTKNESNEILCILKQIHDKKVSFL